MKTSHKLTILFLISAAVLSTCAGNRDERLASKVVAQYHRYYNDQNYEQIFNSAHDEAKRTKSKEALGLALAEAFEKYGKHISSDLVYTKITPVKDNEKQVELVYKSKFEKGFRNETFLIITNGEKGALYAIGELSDDELEKLKSE
ncbi:MAG TPA: hypothetical protein VGC97_04180 [Pyrinomonadaceae bacterium]|jgi:3-deoxy-D-manno-octulosonic acid (KDO) 8-phosphate synthase